MNLDKVSILVPFTTDNGYREKVWFWLKKRYELQIPDIEICIGESSVIPYSRAAAINNAARKATRDIFIIVDADIIFNPCDIEISINELANNLIIPYSRIIRLPENTTKQLLKQKYVFDISKINTSGCEIWTRNDYNTGGLWIIRRSVFENLGGIDERFKGWGFEDYAFLSSVEYVYGKYTRLNNTIWHLFHTKNHYTNEYHLINQKLYEDEYKNNKNLEYTIEKVKKINGFL